MAGCALFLVPDLRRETNLGWEVPNDCQLQQSRISMLTSSNLVHVYI